MNISEKDKKLLVLFGMFLLLIMYYTFFFKNQIAAISDLNGKKEELQQKLYAMENLAKSFDSNSDKEDELKNYYMDVSSKIPPNQDEKFSIMDAYNISKALGTNLGDLVISKRESADFTMDKKKIDKAYNYTLKLNWSLSYENFKKLLSYSKEYETAYTVDSLTAVPDKNGMIDTSIEMKFYGFDDSDAPVRPWNSPDIGIGKSDIFSSAISASSYQKSESDLSYIDSSKDFLVLLSTLNSPTSAITVEKSGKGIDIFGSNKSVETIDINLKGSDGKYTYSMATEANSYPKNGGFEGFTPTSEGIIIHVASTPRKYADDKNRAILNVHNNTDKNVYVYITNDDEKLPRVAVVKDGQGIYVYNR